MKAYLTQHMMNGGFVRLQSALTVLERAVTHHFVEAGATHSLKRKCAQTQLSFTLGYIACYIPL